LGRRDVSALGRPLVTAVAALLVAATFPAGAQPSPAPDAQPERAGDSPRAAVEEYLELCREGDYTSAARYLALRPAQLQRGAELARRLKAVLDRHLWIDLGSLSSSTAGNESDGLAAGIDEIGTVPSPEGRVPVRLVRASGA
jgi:MscS family membrane protein